MRYVVRPAGTFGCKPRYMLRWSDAFDHANDLIEQQYRQVQIGVEENDLGVPTYRPLGYLTREEGVLRWVAWCKPGQVPSLAEYKLSAPNSAMPCT